MSDSLADPDPPTLAADGDLEAILTRVSFQPGVMLGAEALDAEQDYHRRRLNRHQRWLVGIGTVFGLAVDAAPGVKRPDGSTDVTVTVAPGYAIDGLGREVLLPEPYVISLTDWLASQTGAAATALLTASSGGTLFLRVTVRARACPMGLQPTLLPLFDAAIDPVVPSRIGDSVLLELLPDGNRTADAPAGPFGAWSSNRAAPASADIPGPLSAREAQLIQAIAEPAAQKALQLQNWLLRRPLPLTPDGPGAEAALDDAARLLLCSIHVANFDQAKPAAAGDVSVNNLVRPFVRPNALLAAIALP